MSAGPAARSWLRRPSVARALYQVVVDAPIVRAPEWLEELVRPLPPAAPVDLETLPKLTDLSEQEQRRLRSYVERVVGQELDRLDECLKKGWQGPGWNSTTFEVSCSLIELANSPWSPLTLIEARDFVLSRAPRDPGFTDRDVETCFASALKKTEGAGAGPARRIGHRRSPSSRGTHSRTLRRAVALRPRPPPRRSSSVTGPTSATPAAWSTSSSTSCSTSPRPRSGPFTRTASGR